MTRDSLNDRRKALEDSFFARKDAELLREMRQHMDRSAQREALAKASGIANEELLDQLLDLEIRPETMAAMSLVPLVAVAWADNVLDEAERQAVLQAAADAGIRQGDPGYELLAQWFEHPPSEEMLATWKAYIRTLIESLTSGGRETLRDEVVGRAHKIAAASGGILGLGNKISRSEKAVLDDLAAAFD